MKELLEIQHASKWLRKAKVLDDISVTLESGKIYGLQGINGSGKTMLLRLMAGLIYADIGWVRWNGKALGQGLDFPEGTGLFLEKPSFLDRYTGKQNLELLGGLKGVSDDELERTLKDVGLWEARDKKYRKYSLGMKQRLGIGAALLGGPRLLLLDEPLNAIDQESVDHFQKLFLRERDRGAIVVLVSHDAALLDSTCDRKYLMEGGRIRLETEK